MKKLFSAAVIAGAMALTPAIFATAPAVAQGIDAEQLAAMEAEIEALLIANADDPDAFAAAVEAYVTASANAEIAGEAVINVLTNPKSDAAKLALANNPGLKTAGGAGLGAAIAVIGITDPTAAANMQAKVEASGDTTLQASVSQGTDSRTATLQQQQQQQQTPGAGDTRDSTPETPASPN
ncbi:hypothetical protein [uncultured Parvibaculum sp.]|uniref:hypothetical protein n=1 Tax=uncultured Parvibaculum sp. TaxID=291828 RepID=UPI0030DDC8EF